MDLTVLLKGQTCNLKLKNPVIAASGTFGNGLEFAPYGNLADLGGISVKGISLRARRGNLAPRIVETAAGMLNAIGLQNDGVDNFLDNILPSLPWRDTAIIANIYAETVDEFGELARRFAGESKIAALEINVSCPNVQAGGALFGQSTATCEAVTSICRKNAPDKHLIVKLSPNVTSIADIAMAAEAGGADSISAINTLLGMAIDVKTRKPRLANKVGGLSGPAIKPVGLRCVWQIYQAVKIPVIGLGGIVSTDDILEYLLAGASAIQIGTANFMQPDLIFKLASSLPAALKNKNVRKPAELTGALRLD